MVVVEVSIRSAAVVIIVVLKEEGDGTSRALSMLGNFLFVVAVRDADMIVLPSWSEVVPGETSNLNNQ